MKSTIVPILSFVLLACGGGQSSEPNTPNKTPEQGSKAAQDYVDEVIDIMRENVLTRYEVDWGDLETVVKGLAANATAIHETYPAILKALEIIDTNHSFLLSPSGELVAYYSELNCYQNPDMTIPALDNIGYVRVDGFDSSDSEEGKLFATEIQNTIAQQDNVAIKGWIVDLRQNSGGNMFPMITGLGPFFDSAVQGYFIDADENITPWGYDNGTTLLGDRSVLSIASPYQLLNPTAKIAVLSSRLVASSGEATLIAFKKQHNVRIFGTNSCGQSTANRGYALSDGSTLLLTTSIMADREQQPYGEKVSVDVDVAQGTVVSTAVDWIHQ